MVATQPSRLALSLVVATFLESGPDSADNSQSLAGGMGAWLAAAAALVGLSLVSTLVSVGAEVTNYSRFNDG